MEKEKSIKIHQFQGKRITFDFGNNKKMVNATEIAKVFPNKRIQDFFRTRQTVEYILALDKHLNKRGENIHLEKDKIYSTQKLATIFPEIIRTVRGGKKELQGTWVNEKLAIKLTGWLSPYFEIWMHEKIIELLTTGKAELNPYPISDKELLLYMKKITDNSLEASKLADHIIQRKEGLYLPPED